MTENSPSPLKHSVIFQLPAVLTYERNPSTSKPEVRENANSHTLVSGVIKICETSQCYFTKLTV